MYIINYQSMLTEIADKIVNNRFRHKSNIIIGDNSIGKSEILKILIEMYHEKIYFIDSQNRSFNHMNVSKLENIEQYGYKNITNYRKSIENFNLRDSFNITGTGVGAIEQIYFNYNKVLKEFIKNFLNIQLEIKLKDDEILGEIPELYIDNNKRDKLSNGYQAIIRIFLENIFFESCFKNNDEKHIIIEELNEFLSPKNEEKILPFLMHNFPQTNFIVTTHSADVVVSSVNCNVIVLKSNAYECLDSNDFMSITDVRNVFRKTYDIDLKVEDEVIDTVLRNLLNIKISGKWTNDEEDKLDSLNKNELSNAQLLMKQQIKGW